MLALKGNCGCTGDREEGSRINRLGEWLEIDGEVHHCLCIDQREDNTGKGSLKYSLIQRNPLKGRRILEAIIREQWQSCRGSQAGAEAIGLHINVHGTRWILRHPCSPASCYHRQPHHTNSILK